MKITPVRLLAPLTLAIALSVPARSGGTPPELALPHTFASGTPALAEEVNENFEALLGGGPGPRQRAGPAGRPCG